MLATIFLAAQVAAAPQSFASAKAEAIRLERAMSKVQHTAFLDMQGRALVSALDACGPPGKDLSPFTVVLQVEASGTVSASWREGETALAQCVERKLSATTFTGKWSAPRYMLVGAILREP